MSMSIVPNSPKPEVISLLHIALEALAQDQLTQPISWVDFLAALQWFCAIRGWSLEYNFLTDYSCAIFAHEETPEMEGGEACQVQREE